MNTNPSWTYTERTSSAIRSCLLAVAFTGNADVVDIYMGKGDFAVQQRNLLDLLEASAHNMVERSVLARGHQMRWRSAEDRYRLHAWRIESHRDVVEVADEIWSFGADPVDVWWAWFDLFHDGEYVDSRTAAARLGVTGSRIRQMCAAGALNAYRENGTHWRIEQSSLKGRRIR